MMRLQLDSLRRALKLKERDEKYKLHKYLPNHSYIYLDTIKITTNPEI